MFPRERVGAFPVFGSGGVQLLPVLSGERFNLLFVLFLCLGKLGEGLFLFPRDFLAFDLGEAELFRVLDGQRFELFFPFDAECREFLFVRLGE